MVQIHLGQRGGLFEICQFSYIGLYDLTKQKFTKLVNCNNKKKSLMKAKITKNNVLRRTSPERVLALLEEKDLYQKMVDAIRNTKKEKLKIAKKYIKFLDNITFFNHNLYEWDKK